MPGGGSNSGNESDSTGGGTGGTGSTGGTGNTGTVNPTNVRISTYAPLPTQFESTDDWIVYADRLEQYFLAYDINDTARMIQLYY